MTLSQFLLLIRDRWISVTALALLGAGLGIAYSSVATPMYQASTRVFVSVSGGASAADLSQANSFSEARVKSYTALAVTPRVLGLAAKRLGLSPERSSALARVVAAEAEPDTVLISIRASDASPQRAAAIANAVTDELIASVNKVEQPTDSTPGLVRLSVFQDAVAPAAPYAPRGSVNLAIGLLAGLACGIGLAMLRHSLDTRLRSNEHVRRITDVSILSELPMTGSDGVRTLITEDARYSTRSEAFRQLRTHLSFTNLEGARSQSIVVTSATPGEGKSSTAANLALVLAQSGSSVVLVDADMRRPTVGTTLGLESRVGLSTILARQVELEDALQTLGGDAPLDVITSGRVPPNPSELLGSESMAYLIRELEARYDHVVIDAPPILPVTDPAILGGLSSGVLLVVAADGKVRRTDVAQAVGRLEQVGVRLLGVALNKVPTKRRAHTYYNYETAAPVSESPRRSSRAKAQSSRPNETSRA
jgi:polysaccharide biosynthesis transport protein